MTTPTLTNPSLTAAICNMERQAWQALCKSGAALLPLLSSNPVMIFPGDIILSSVSSPTLPEMLQSAEFQPWQSFALSHDEVIILGKDSALIYYRVEATRAGDTFKAICSSTWVLEDQHDRDNEGWKMVHHQQTLIQ